MDHATVFMIDKSQAIRLSKAVALPKNVKRVQIIKLGQVRYARRSAMGQLLR